MEIDEKTKAELEEIKLQKYNEWNVKMNDIAKEILDLLREKQINVHDFNEIIKVVTGVTGKKMSELNINYILNHEVEKEGLKNN